jgi:DNA polymerase delta subunit 4
MKGFYRQRKNSGVTKPSSTTKKASKPSSSLKKSPKHAATFGSDVTQPAALLSHGSPDLKGLSPSLSPLSLCVFYYTFRVFLFG